MKIYQEIICDDIFFSKSTGLEQKLLISVASTAFASGWPTVVETMTWNRLMYISIKNFI